MNILFLGISFVMKIPVLNSQVHSNPIPLTLLTHFKPQQRIKILTLNKVNLPNHNLLNLSLILWTKKTNHNILTLTLILPQKFLKLSLNTHTLSSQIFSLGLRRILIKFLRQPTYSVNLLAKINTLSLPLKLNIKMQPVNYLTI